MGKRKWTHEKVKNFIEIESGSGCRLISEEYTNTKIKLKIQCKCKEIFEVSFEKFKGRGKQQCNKCNGIVVLDIESVKNYVELNSDCKLISRKYKNNHSKLKFRCKCGNDFLMSFMQFKHNGKRQCNECSSRDTKTKLKYSNEKIRKIIEEDYSILKLKWIEGEYINKETKLVIVDEEGYKYSLSLSNINVLSRNGLKPGKIYSNNSYSVYNIQHYLRQNNIPCTIISDKYINANNKLLWMCKEGHRFTMSWTGFSVRHMCPICSGSHGEEKIERWLVHNKISNVRQKTFKNLLGTGNGNLSYDFYLPNYNLLIEFQGIQHSQPVEYFGGNLQFKKQQIHDERKRNYAKENNYRLLEIWHYDFDKIEEILEQIIVKAGDL